MGQAMRTKGGATVIPGLHGLETHAIHIPASARTHAGFRAWATSCDYPEKLNASFINGEITIHMSPEELETHNKLKTCIVSTVYSLNIELLGTPDWTLEVVSQSSVGKDTETLRDSYHRAGVPEYWLVDGRFDDLAF